MVYNFFTFFSLKTGAKVQHIPKVLKNKIKIILKIYTIC